MSILLFLDTFDLLTLTEKLLWSVAVISTVLLLVLTAMSFFEEHSEETYPTKTSRNPLDAKVVLLFFTFFGWASILAHLWEPSIPKILVYGLPVGIIAAIAPIVLGRLKIKYTLKPARVNGFQLREAITSTGEVLEYIPPDINGKGTVHLNLRNAPYQINAVSKNGELSAGVPVRVVAILDDNTVVVEPLDGRAPNLPNKAN